MLVYAQMATIAGLALVVVSSTWARAPDEAVAEAARHQLAMGASGTLVDKLQLPDKRTLAAARLGGCDLVDCAASIAECVAECWCDIGDCACCVGT